MLKEIVKSFGSVLYIQIWKNHIKATNLKTGKIYNEPSLLTIERNPEGQSIVSAIGNNVQKITNSPNTIVINPFAHPRVLINEFLVAEKMLQHIVYVLLGKHRIGPRPKIIIHPMEEYKGGITLLEHRAFIEIALAAGAKEVTVYTGAEIPISRLDFDKIKEESAKNLPSYVSFKTKRESHLPLSSSLAIVAIVITGLLWFTSF